MPLPGGLVARLKASLVPGDDEVDAALRSVAVSPVMLARLREIPADVAVDEALSDLASPPALIHALRRPTLSDRLTRLGRQVQRLVVAASWFVAVSAVLGGSVGAILRGTYPRAGDEQELVFIYNGPLSVSAAMVEVEVRQPSISMALAANEPTPLAESAAAAEPPINRISQPEMDAPAGPGPVAEWVSLVASGMRPMDDAVLMRYGVLGSPHYADDQLPDLVAPRLPRAAGIEPPPVRGYDRAFFLKHRIFPPIVPAAHPRLQDLEVPLVTSSDAFSQIERTLAEGRLPQSHDVRVADLIAAMDYRLAPAPAGKLAIRTAAGPALFGPPESGLLLVGVQAGSFARRPQAATHLVLAIDLSHSMSRGGRLEILQRAIGRLLDQLGRGDRLSLVVFNEEVVQVVEAATRDDAASIRQLIDGLSPRGGTNLAAGLQQAASLAMTDAAGPRAAARLVLITDSQVSMSPDTRAGVEQVLLAAGHTGVRLDVLDLSQRGQIDATLLDWAQQLDGDVRPVADARQVYCSLLEALSGREATIARDARLKLHFNPQAVAAYRLVGHEANPLADLRPAAVEAELAAGETAAALVELWFQPGDSDDLGYAELTWMNPDGGQPQRVRQRISRLQFAPTAGEAPLSLLQAALAAEVGEVLRGSHDALRQAGVRQASQRGMSDVLEAAQTTNSQLRQRPDVARLLQLARELQRQGLK